MRIVEQKVFFDRDELYNRHRLSCQQINRLLGENRRKEFLPEILAAFEMVKVLIGLVDLLNANSIPYISIKGPLLSQQIYGDPTVRLSHDLDILVDIKDIDRLHEVLLGNGYELGYGLSWPKVASHRKHFSNHLHHIAFKNLKSGIFVEVHWSLLSYSPIAPKLLSKIVWENTTFVEFSGRKIKTFSMEFGLAYLVIHGAKHGWQRLKWLVDIKDYPFEQVDRERFLMLVENLNAKRAVSQVGLLLKYYWGIDNPFFPIATFPSYLIKHALFMLDSPVENATHLMSSLKTYWYRVLIFEGITYKWRVVRLSLFSAEDLSRITLPHILLYYLYRPYSFIKRRLIYANK